MKKIYILFFALIVLISFFTIIMKQELKEEKIDNILDQLSLNINRELKKHQMDDLKVALLLSKNRALIDALENDDEDLGYEILSDMTKSIEENTKMHIRAQVITNELNIFARSWDDIYAGMPIGDFRKDLDYFKTNKTPRASVEIGRRLGNKSTVPIYKDGIFLGYIEVISFFKSITEFFASMGVELYVLLDVDHLESAVLMMQNLTVDDYVVANRNYNYNHIQTLKKIDFKELKLNRVIYKDSKYIFYENMYDGNMQNIGGFVFVLPEVYLEYFRNPNDDISFLVNITRSDLYEIVKDEKYNENIYTSYDANSFVYLQDVIDKEDREMFFDEVYNKLDSYTKDELIQMMLDRQVVKKIDGKIK
ncbi:hypothetical protein GJV85_07735 [Sulfurimonas aquatica]|uniref:Double Cache domain-containing protein n=1 Tax=Sulfurimonas aquatica TaxID=2672570 RepID=A0A975B0S1_9BACT|nr:cache domain-containing protein [Sulfurimonas aquatica]QSZ42003.1 hypothetical protein GJV85_07735 [Sulfurimonas aquatica]